MKKEYVDELASRLIEQIKSNTAPWQKPWQPGVPNASLPINVVTAKPYNGMNLINLMSKAEYQGYDDPRWMTYKQAQGLGGQVKKGEKGTSIHYWKFFDEKVIKDENNKPVLDEHGKPKKIRIQLERPQVFFATVFNANQVDGLPPLTHTIPVKEEWERHQQAEQILNASGVPIRHLSGDKAYYSPGLDRITMPERQQFDSGDKYYATALHELGHATGHPSRLNRDLTGGFGSESYAKEELRAEIASMMIGQELQIGHDPGQHVAYLQSWVKVLENDPKEIFRAARDAEQITKFVMALQQQQEQTQTEDQSILSLTKIDQSYQSVDNLALTSPLQAWQLLEQAAKSRGYTAKLNIEENPDNIALSKIEVNYFNDSGILPFSNTIGGNGFVRAIENNQILPYNTNIAEVIGPILIDMIDRHENRLKPVNPVDTSLLDEFATHKASYPGLSNPLDSWNHISQYAQNMGYSADVSRNPDTSEGASPYLIEYYDQDRKTGVQSLMEVDGKVLTQFDQVRTQGTGYTSDEVWQQDSLRAALQKDFDQKITQLAKVPNDERNQSLLAGLTTLAEFDKQGEFYQSENAPYRQSILDNLIRENFDNPKFTGISLPHTDGGHILVEKSAQAAGQWQVTIFDSAGEPIRDNGTQDKREALETFFSGVHIEASVTGLAKREKIYLDVPYHEKNEVKGLGAKWDKKEKAWYIMSDQNNVSFNKWIASDNKPEATSTINPEPSQASSQKVYLTVPFADKESVKALGAKWDRKEKAWYIAADTSQEPFSKWLPGDTDNTLLITVPVLPVELKENTSEHNVFLAVPYEERDAAKECGARWDNEQKLWYAPEGTDLTPLQNWLPENQPYTDHHVHMDLPHQQVADPRVEFAAALREAGLVIEGEPQMDGKLQRVRVEGDTSSELSGAYKGHLDGRPAGYIKNFRTGLEQKWKSTGKLDGAVNTARLRAEAAQRRQNNATQQEHLYEQVAEKAELIMDFAEPCITHRYLQEKDVLPHGLKIVPEGNQQLADKGILIGNDWKQSKELREAHPDAIVLTKGDLIVPAYDAQGKLWTMQTIGHNGFKSFLKDGKKSGNFFLLGQPEPGKPIIAAEGFATAATLREVTNQVVAVAFDSGNLNAVAMTLREQYEPGKLYIAADNDHVKEAERRAAGHTHNLNVGIEKAQQAARANQGFVLTPKFKADDKGTDWNDLKRSQGVEVVKTQLRQALAIAQLQENKAKVVEHSIAATQQQVESNSVEPETLVKKLIRHPEQKQNRGLRLS